MNQQIKFQKLIEAEEQAKILFSAIDDNGLIKSGISEKDLSNDIYQLAKEKIGISKYWHKRIVRSGINTILPYDHNPDDRIIEQDDILWIDFGPVFEDYEADIGRTYILGNDSEKKRIKDSVENAWYQARDLYFDKEKITGKELFEFLNQIAMENEYIFGNEIAGHLIDAFPHNRIHKKDLANYICQDNSTDLKSLYDEKDRFWILEVHFIHKERRFGSFFEQLLR
jgi:Xaa-Pro aminopeptidase